MELYLLRHGEAGKRLPASSRDRERSLTATGREEVERIGGALAEAELAFDIVATSPLKRAMETATIVNKSMRRKGDVEEWAELTPEGSRDALYKRLAKLKADASVMVVGHEPYLTTAVSEIISRGERNGTLRIVLKKGGLARISVTGFNPKIMGELRWLLTPRQIRKLA